MKYPPPVIGSQFLVTVLAPPERMSYAVFKS